MMEDIRRKSYQNNLKKRVLYNNIFLFFKKNYIKILIITLILFIIFFPSQTGNILGEWCNTLYTSFIEKIKH